MCESCWKTSFEVDGLGLDVELAGEESDGLGEAGDGEDVEPLDDGGLGGVGGGDEQAVAALGDGLERHGEDALEGPGLAGECELADDGEGAGPVEGDLPAAQEQPQGDGQVEAAGVLLEVGRGKVDDDPVDRAAISRVDDRALDPVRALADGGLRQSDQHGLGLRGERDVDLDFHRCRIDSDERVRGELGEHERSESTPGATSIAGDERIGPPGTHRADNKSLARPGGLGTSRPARIVRRRIKAARFEAGIEFV